MFEIANDQIVDLKIFSDALFFFFRSDKSDQNPGA